MLVSDLFGPWSAIRRAPMLRLAWPFVLGVAVATGTEPRPEPAMFLLAASSVLLLLMMLLPTDPARLWRRGAMLTFWLMAYGAAWQAYRSPRNDALHASNVLSGDGHWLLDVEQVNRAGDRAVTADATLIAFMSDDSVGEARGRVLLTLWKEADVPAVISGDRLLVSGSLQAINRIPDPGGFDRRQWAASRGIAHELAAFGGRWSVVAHHGGWTDWFAGIRAQVGAWLAQSGLNAREAALVKALVLGERDELDGERKDAFVRSGTIHVLAVSGMHVGLIYIVITSALRWLGRWGWGRILRGLLVLLCLWFYAGLTGAAPSVMRATAMFSLFTLAGIAQARTDSLNSLFAAALVLLLWDPGMITQASFLLSFLAVLGIILFHRPMEKLWSPSNGFVRKVWSLAVMSISAQLLTTPVSLMLFKGFPIWFLPANLVVVVVAGFAVYGGVALIVLHAVPFVSDAIVAGLRVLIMVIDMATGFIAQLPFAYPAVRISWAEAIIGYVLILSAGAWWQWRWSAARFAALGSCMALLVGWGLRAGAARERDAMVLYDQSRGFVAGFATGRTLVLVSSADSLLADARVMAKVERHARAFGISRIVPAGTDNHGDSILEHADVLMAAGRVRTPRLNVLFHDGTQSAEAFGRYDAIVLHGQPAISEAEVALLASQTSRFVLSADLPWKDRALVSRWAEQHGFAVHDIKWQGAFVFE